MEHLTPEESPDGWGRIPAVRNTVASSVPDASGTSVTQTVQGNAADAQQNLSVNLLPPAPNWVNPVDQNGKMSQPWMFWLELLRRRVGGSNTIPASDIELLGLVDVPPPPLFQQSAIDNLAKLLDSGASDAYVSSLRNAIESLAEQQALCCNDSGQQFTRPLADAQTDALFSDPVPTQALMAQIADLQQSLAMVQEPGSFSTNFTGRLSTFTDNLFQVVGSSDPTKVMKFEVDGFTTATTRTITPLDANIIMAGSAAALTSGRFPIITTGGLLTDSSAFTYSGSAATFTGSFTAASLITSNGNVTIQRTANPALNYTDTTASKTWGSYYQHSATKFWLASESGVADWVSVANGTGQLNLASTLQATSTTAASLTTAGGLGVAKISFFGDKINLAANTAVSANGDVSQDATQKAVAYFVDGVKQVSSTVVFTATATATVANTTTETTILGSGVGTKTIPANFFVAGKTLRVMCNGVMSTTGTPNLQVKVKLGSTVLLDTTSIAVASTIPTNACWQLDAFLTCRTTGATGTIQGIGDFDYQTGSSSVGADHHWLPSNLATVDTTASAALDVTVTWGTADVADTLSCTIVVIEVLN